ncbi:MAG: hypothetical protein M0006_10975 [Magnetospirillum sp.]|nr:hypothetical protein [Magnetospirillum sp.]
MKSVEPATLGRTPPAATQSDPAAVSAPASLTPSAADAKDAQQHRHPSGPQYLSPVTQIDPQTGVAVLAIRDVQSGKILGESPSRQVIEEYRRLTKDHNPGNSPAVGSAATGSSAGNTGSQGTGGGASGTGADGQGGANGGHRRSA